MKTNTSIKNSVLWAAYGDALGFITELTDTERLKYRTNGLEKITDILSWKRKLGGKFGVSITLPKGCYSDDTQLRIAVGRSILKNGSFDYETFSKVELPIFLSYGLGVGRGTKAACESLQKVSIQWNTNFYGSNGSSYLGSGGNGAAMRIQPHVWTATPDKSIRTIISDIIHNSIITHGHPVALVGAVFHGLSLFFTYEHGTPPKPEQWSGILDKARSIVDICSEDDQLSKIWLPLWESKTKKSFAQSVHAVIREMENDIQTIIKEMSDNDSRKVPTLYSQLIELIDGFNPSVRGSATKTALLANCLSFAFRRTPIQGIQTCVNSLGSDTDTIATMAGALLGACNDEEPPQQTLDYEYLVSEANRFYEISNNKSYEHFSYPDLMTLNLPKSHLDFVGTFKEKLAICGLGAITPFGPKILQKRGGNEFTWQYYKTSFGQSLLLKHRAKPAPLELQTLPLDFGLTRKKQNIPEIKPTVVASHTGVRNKKGAISQGRLPFEPPTLDAITTNIINGGFNAQDIGRELLRFADEDDGLEKSIAFAAVIIKAKKARK